MSLHLAIRAASLFAAAACLALGFALAGYWLILVAMPVMVLLWMAAGKHSPFWTACALLSIYVALAAVGLSLHVPALPMALGCVFALTGWELSDPRGRTTGQALLRHGDLLERRRIQALASSAAASAVLIVLAGRVRLQLPFGIVVLLALLLAGCVLYTVHYLRTTKPRTP